MNKPMETLIREIEQFCAENKMAESTFGLRAANDGKLLRRLRSGGRMWPENAEAVRSFIRSHLKEAS